MWTAARVIGENVKALRRDRFSAAELGARIGELLGKAWPRQTIYLLEQGERKVSAEEVVALSEVLGVSVADLFVPPHEADEVQVGQTAIPRERLLARGRDDGQRLYEVASHTQALRRSAEEARSLMRAQQVVLANIDNALRGRPPVEPPDLSEERSALARAAASGLAQDIERAGQWYVASAGQFAELDDYEEEEDR